MEVIKVIILIIVSLIVMIILAWLWDNFFAAMGGTLFDWQHPLHALKNLSSGGWFGFIFMFLLCGIFVFAIGYYEG